MSHHHYILCHIIITYYVTNPCHVRFHRNPLRLFSCRVRVCVCVCVCVNVCMGVCVSGRLCICMYLYAYSPVTSLSLARALSLSLARALSPSLPPSLPPSLSLSPSPSLFPRPSPPPPHHPFLSFFVCKWRGERQSIPRLHVCVCVCVRARVYTSDILDCTTQNLRLTVLLGQHCSLTIVRVP